MEGQSSKKSEQLRETIESLGYFIVGQRIRRIRDRLGWSIRELADRAQVSKNTITRLEKGEAVHLSTIKVLAKALKYTPEKLVSNTFDSDHTYNIHRKGESIWYNVNGFQGFHSPELTDDQLVDVPVGTVPFCMLSSRKFDGLFNPNLMIISEPTMSRSHRGEEFAYVVSGQCRVVFEHNSVELETGESIYFWAAEVHSYEPVGDTPTLILSIVIDSYPTANEATKYKRRPSFSPKGDLKIPGHSNL